MSTLEVTFVKPLCRMSGDVTKSGATHREMALQVLEKYLHDHPPFEVAGSVMCVRDPDNPDGIVSWWRVIIEHSAGAIDKYDIELASGMNGTTPIHDWEM